ncbi:unnamed protein product [Vitrella brassicaformis CCMP3155]|uniref:Tyrosine-protein kinase ephrin type A/B receptor-like domain-containing protein n=2 Tax=Vitrella brassicaformis TaxID=1169539 RepID=A0A0G4GRE8_VITBC|nr:unnamed protein product [Vitrella brassicaformis CCMP3155]|eukprot:CEM33095.1 unnamed protein product [Vitrella brassicaformis CCMP3155]
MRSPPSVCLAAVLAALLRPTGGAAVTEVYLATAEGLGSGETRTYQLAVGEGGQLPFGDGYLDLRVEIAVTKSRDCERGNPPVCSRALLAHGSLVPAPAKPHNDTTFDTKSLTRHAVYQDDRSLVITWSACSWARMQAGRVALRVVVGAWGGEHVINIRAMLADNRPYSLLCPGPLPLVRHSHTLDAVGPQVIVFGGKDDTGEATNDLWRLNYTLIGDGALAHVDPLSMVWESLDDVYGIFLRPPSRHGHVSVVSERGVLLIYGGKAGDVVLDDMWAIQLLTPQEGGNGATPFKWFPLPPLTSARPPPLVHTAATTIGPRLYVFGGEATQRNLTNHLWTADLSTVFDGWSAAGPKGVEWELVAVDERRPTPVARMGHSMVPALSPPQILSAIKKRINDTQSPAHQGEDLLQQKGLLVFGGRTANTMATNDLWFLMHNDTGPSVWFQVKEPIPPNARVSSPPSLAFHSSVALNERSFTLIGGMRGDNGRHGGRNHDAGTVSSQMWAYVNGTFTLTHTSALPPVIAPDQYRVKAAAAYVPPIGKVLIHGGGWTVPSSEHSSLLRQLRGADTSPGMADMRATVDHKHPPTMHSSVLVVYQDACTPANDQDCTVCGTGSRAVPYPVSDANDTSFAEHFPWVGNTSDASACVPCPPGHYHNHNHSDINNDDGDGEVECVPCPAGFYQPFRGQWSSSSCLPCPRGTHAKEAGTATCKACGGNIWCPLGSSEPLEKIDPANSIVYQHDEPHAASLHESHLLWQVSTFSVGLIVLAASLCVLNLLHVKAPKRVNSWMRQIDSRAITGVIFPSEAGGVCTLVYTVLAVCIILLVFMQQLFFNYSSTDFDSDFHVRAVFVGYPGPCEASNTTRVTQLTDQGGGGHAHQHPEDHRARIVPIHSYLTYRAHDASFRLNHLQTQRKWSILPAVLPFIVSVDTRRQQRDDNQVVGEGEAIDVTSEDEKRPPKMEWRCGQEARITALGLVPKNISTASSVSCAQIGPQQCVVEWSCRDCGVFDQRLHLNIALSHHTFAAAQAIQWEVMTVWRESGSSTATTSTPVEAFSTLNSTFVGSDPNNVLRGEDPTVLRLTLVPTDYENQRLGVHENGFLLQYIASREGSATDGVHFHSSGDGPSTVQFRIELTVSPFLYRLLLTQTKTFFDYLAQVLGLLSGMSLLVRVLVSFWLSIPRERRKTMTKYWGESNSLMLWLVRRLCACVDDVDRTDPSAETPSHLYQLCPSPSSPPPPLPAPPAIITMARSHSDPAMETPRATAAPTNGVTHRQTTGREQEPLIEHRAGPQSKAAMAGGSAGGWLSVFSFGRQGQQGEGGGSWQRVTQREAAEEDAAVRCAEGEGTAA